MKLKDFIEYLRKNKAGEEYDLAIGEDMNGINHFVEYITVNVEKAYIYIDHHNKRIVIG
jgi:hypothetical protein